MNKNDEFSDLIMEHSEKVQRFIYTLTKDNYAKDEILQNSIIKAYRHFDSLKSKESFFAWVVKIARTETASYFKGERNWSSSTQYEEGNAKDVYNADEEFDRLENKEITDEIRGIIARLKPGQAQVVLLYIDYDMSLKSIAKILDRNYNTVKSQYQRGIATVKTEYGKLAKKRGEAFWLITE